MQAPIRVLIADDHPAVLAGLRALLSSQGDLAVVGAAADGHEAVALWQQLQPDVGLFDLRMPGLDGLAALRQIRQGQADAAVIILTAQDRDGDTAAALAAGARGCLCKESSLEAIVAGIRSARAGWRKRAPARTPQDGLTPRETEVLRQIAHGWTNARVAAALGVGAGTVKTHLKRLYGKLCARNRTEAVVLARNKGWL